MKASLNSQRLAVCFAAAATIVLALALTPGAQAEGGFKACGNKQFKIVNEYEGQKSTTVVPVKEIGAKGTSCAAAYEFIRLTFEPKQVGGGFPQHYHCKAGTFDTPTGYFAQVCTKPGKTIKYAQPGG